MTATLSRAGSLQGQLRGDLVDPSNAEYGEARKLYNAMHDPRPAMIVQAANDSDVAAAVAFFASDAAEYITGQTLSVSGGLTMA